MGLEIGLGRVIELEKISGGKDLRFSCIGLTRGLRDKRVGE